MQIEVRGDGFIDNPLSIPIKRFHDAFKLVPRIFFCAKTQCNTHEYVLSCCHHRLKVSPDCLTRHEELVRERACRKP